MDIFPLMYIYCYTVITHYSYGAQKSGLVCAALSLLESVENNAFVDVFNVVKRIRKSRPQFVATLVRIKNLLNTKRQIGILLGEFLF
jgi:uncharacterized protein YsxB (DUF464 family)